MSACTFFGHSDTPKETEPRLCEALIHLIENKNVDLFYVGNHGNFDRMVKKNLKILKDKYPHIDYAVVLSYIPGKKYDHSIDFSDTIYPDGLELLHPKYAIIGRNRWMIDHSDYVITYVNRSFGGAAEFKRIAEKKGRVVINLATAKHMLRREE